MEMLQKDIDRFDKKDIENKRFWLRLGGMPEVNGSVVLDIGCGHGGLCIDLALSGAKKVIGLDINHQLIEFARENLRVNYSHLQDIVEFESINLKNYHNNLIYDYIFSKDSFEHIIPMEEMLNEMKKKLKPGGKIYIGFGPLYNSINGAHMERVVIPWGHLLLPESLYLRITSWDRKHEMSSMDDFGLNRLKLSDYMRIFKNSGLSIVYFKMNQSNNKIVKLFNFISKISFLKEYFTSNIYCIVEKKNNV